LFPVSGRGSLGQSVASLAHYDSGWLEVAGFWLDLVCHEVQRGDHVLQLTQHEFSLLEYLRVGAGQAYALPQRWLRSPQQSTLGFYD
jgi:DNA-binding response OmpR family regulator